MTNKVAMRLCQLTIFTSQEPDLFVFDNMEEYYYHCSEHLSQRTDKVVWLTLG